ncbi:MAG: hypothetical protein ABFD96_02125 [Armatimonadia bacterium]
MARKIAARVDPEVQSERRRRAIMIGCGGLVLLALIAVAIIYAMVTGGPRLPREITRRIEQEKTAQQAGATARGGAAATATPAAPEANRYIPQGTPPLPQQLQQLQVAARSGSYATQTLYVSDAELNEMIAARPAHPSIKQMNAYFGNDRAYITAEGQFHGRDLNVTMVAAPMIVNGGVQFVVEQVLVGSFPAPSSVVERVQKEVQGNSDKLSPKQTGLYVDEVEIKPGVAILTGRPVAK